MNEPVGHILYDNTCGFCSRSVLFWGPILRKRGIAMAPLQEEWVQEKLDLSHEELLSDMRLLLADGSQLCGADVYRYVMRRIWWTYPIYLLSSAPLLRSLFDLGYRAFANNRYRISRACRLPPASETHR